MKNHFYIAYSGNKREECENLYTFIKEKISDDSTFIEPYCGSCAVSYFLWLKHPNLKFILNDGNKFLFDMYHLMRDEKRIDELNTWYNDLMEKRITKEEYIDIIKNDDTFSKFLKLKYYCIVEGLYPTKKNFSKIDLRNYGIYNFFKQANIIYTCDDAVELMDRKKNDIKSIIFIDPPYINTCNTQYNYDQSGNIYEYFFKHSIKKFKCSLFGVLECNWIINFLFKDLIIDEYDKLYQKSKKKNKTFNYFQY